MRQLKMILIAVFAMVALGGLGATSAAAFSPLFLTQSGKALLETAVAGLGVLRALDVGVLGTIECQKVLAHGVVLNKSTLAQGVKIVFHTKCEQTVGATKTACTEPITPKEMLVELGLIGGTKVVGALLSPTSGTEFAKVTCGSMTTTVEGAVIGEIPELNAKGENQYNKQRTEGEARFATENKNENQKNATIELLGVTMTKAELKVTGFFGGKGSVECNETAKSAGWIEICTISSCS